MFALQKNTTAVCFKPIGLSLKRDVVDLEIAPEAPEYAIYLRNGMQSLEYQSGAIVGDAYSSQILESFNFLLSQLDMIDKTEWQERYSKNLMTERPVKGWKWDYT
ncbi:MAG: hypothetical protein V4805_11180 [Pseudomonadota bacterium]